MFWADQTGLDRVLANEQEYRARLGEHWTPSPLLERLAAVSKGFYDGVPRGAGL